MADRLRAFLERPLDPSVARAAVVLATAVFAGFATVIALATGGPAPAARHERAVPHRAARTASAPERAADHPDGLRSSSPPGRRQDPQDEAGSAAARRAARELRAHRALQHVPYRRGELVITLVGARRGRAVLRVTAPSLLAAREGWRRFLRRYRDRGDAYRVRFAAAVGSRQRGVSERGDRSGAVASPVASFVASPGVSLVAITPRRRPLDRRHGGDCGDAILPTSLRHIEVWT